MMADGVFDIGICPNDTDISDAARQKLNVIVKLPASRRIEHCRHKKDHRRSALNLILSIVRKGGLSHAAWVVS